MAAKTTKRPPRRLVQAGDIMTMFNIGKTRFTQLRKEPDWPNPIEVASGGAIYDINDVIAYAQARGRTLHPLD